MIFEELLNRLEIIQNIEKCFKKKVLTFYRNATLGNKGLIDECTYNNFRRGIDSIGDTTPLVIIIDSKGGLSYYGWRIASCIMNRTGSTSVIVPEEALSAASMIALAADELIMFDKDSQLSPVDPQFKRGDQWVSALDLLKDKDPVIVSHAEAAIKQTEISLKRLCNSKLSPTKLNKLVDRFLLRDKVDFDHASSIFIKDLQKLGLPLTVRADADVKALHEAYRRQPFNTEDAPTIIEYQRNPIPIDVREILEQLVDEQISPEDAEKLLMLRSEET